MKAVLVSMIFVGLLVFVIALIVTNDPIINRVYTSKSQATEQVYCTYMGMCSGCSLALDGSYDCGAKFKYCDGEQSAIVDTYQMKYTHKSGKISYGVDKRTVKTLDSCQ